MWRWLGVVLAPSALLLCTLLPCARAQQTGAYQTGGYQTPGAPLAGSAWYPEQWPESHWDQDLALMEAAHLTVVRIGEFAWSSEEPSEGVYTLDWIDRAIALAARHGLKVVLSTPTDAPPAWLTAKYPETLGTDADGHLREHGNRRQFNYANPHYRALCVDIATRLAERFGHNPDVIGWQIGNEYTDESFDPETRHRFQQFLEERYGTLANLNARWTTAYWSQAYDRWDEIPLPTGGGNPGLLLEHKHFVTATWRAFQRAQIDALRPHIEPTQFITTNIGGLGWSDNWDHYAMTADLDLASWDDYVGQGHLNATKNAMMNDFVRGWKRENFWLMETQPGSVNWAPVNNALAPGETRALAWQAVGHGADAVLYWQWRGALNGQEQYHGGLVGPDGKPLPIYAEIAQLGHDFELTRAALAGTSPRAEVALLFTYDSRWAIDFQPQSRDYDQQAVLQRFYAPLERQAQSIGEAVDVIDPTQPGDLSHYKALVAPSLNVIPQALGDKLLAWVRAGGNLILGPRSGMKDEYNALDPRGQPGPLREALKAGVEQFYALDKPVLLTAEPGGDVLPVVASADTWAEVLTPGDPAVRPSLFYAEGDDSWLGHKAAEVSATVGKGFLSYLGTVPEARMMPAGNASPRARWGFADGVEVCARYGDHRAVFVVINHDAVTREVTSPAPTLDMLQPGPAAQRRTLPPQGVAVLVWETP